MPEAGRLTRIPTQRLRRWTKGYSYRYHGETRRSAPIVTAMPGMSAEPLLTFADLIEAQFIDGFLKHGVPMATIRYVLDRARELLGSTTPFSTGRLLTDGRSILHETTDDHGAVHLLNLIRDQYELDRVVGPFLRKVLDFDQSGTPSRWWPLGRDRLVVIDPRRSFGAPISPRSGVPTRVLKAAAEAEGSTELAAEWHEVGIEEVADAVEYERQLAA